MVDDYSSIRLTDGKTMIPTPCLEDICYQSEECILFAGSGGLYLRGGPEMIAAVEGCGRFIALLCGGGDIAAPPESRDQQRGKRKMTC
jgi:hypothetical protein